MYLCSRSRISSKRVGSFPTARQFDYKSVPPLPLQSKIIRTYSSPRHKWLQQNTACTACNQRPSPREDNQLLHLGTPCHKWMVHWSIFRALLMRGMLHPINTQRKNCKYSWIHFHSYPYYQDKFRGLSPSINHINYLSLGIPKVDSSLPLIWRQYKKFSKIGCHTPQPLHKCTKSYQDNNNSYFPSAYIAIVTDSKTTSSCTQPCTIDGNYPLVITTATVVITITPFFG